MTKHTRENIIGSKIWEQEKLRILFFRFYFILFFPFVRFIVFSSDSPHLQVGDFGILVRSGFSVSKALFFNFLSALVALAGTALVSTIFTVRLFYRFCNLKRNCGLIKNNLIQLNFLGMLILICLAG